DSHYPTLTGPADTFVGGSSMGAIISIYAICEYPRVFGGAAGLSVHWTGTMRPNADLPLAVFNYLHANLAPPQGHRLYMDHGTATIDAWYAPYQLFVDEIVHAAGYTEKNFQTRVFEGAAHEESAWAKRVALPLEFLLAP